MESRQVPVGIYNHKVNIEGFFSNLPDMFYNRQSERDIRNKESIHYITVNPVGQAFIQHPDILSEVQKISSKQ